MYLGKMTCDVRLAGKYQLRGVNSIVIKKSVHQIVQTATVSLALTGIYKNNDVNERVKLTDRIKEGDAISVAFGYDGKNDTEFTGYIKRINPKQPLELECEDEMYLLRKIRIKASWKKADIKEVLQKIVAAVWDAFGVRIKLMDSNPKVEVYNFVCKEANGIAILQDLADKYLLASSLKRINGELYLFCGLLYGYKINRVKHVLNRNTISIDDLKYQPGRDTNYKIEIVNNRPDGTTKKFVFGNEKGSVHREPAAGFITDEMAKHLADARLMQLNTASYKGSFTQFLMPYAEPGTITDLSDLQFPDRGGAYYIGTVITEFSASGGGRRKCEIDIRL